MDIDYKALLQKYMEHVRSCEGTDFIGGCYREYSDFTVHEFAELQIMSNEVDKVFEELRNR